MRVNRGNIDAWRLCAAAFLTLVASLALATTASADRLVAKEKGRNFDVAVSPDGKRIAWTVAKQNSSYSGPHKVWIAGSDGSDPHVLIDRAREPKFVTSPDGSVSIVVARPAVEGGTDWNPGTEEIALVDPESGKVLANHEVYGWAGYPAQLGHRVIFTSWRFGPRSFSALNLSDPNGPIEPLYVDYEGGSPNYDWRRPTELSDGRLAFLDVARGGDPKADCDVIVSNADGSQAKRIYTVKLRYCDNSGVAAYGQGKLVVTEQADSNRTVFAILDEFTGERLGEVPSTSPGGEMPVTVQTEDGIHLYFTTGGDVREATATDEIGSDKNRGYYPGPGVDPENPDELGAPETDLDGNSGSVVPGKQAAKSTKCSTKVSAKSTSKLTVKAKKAKVRAAKAQAKRCKVATKRTKRR